VLHLCSCREGTPAGEKRPLFDKTLAPDILTEQKNVSLPSSGECNRFLKGWWPSRKNSENEIYLAPSLTESRIQVVSLSDRARTLTLNLEALGPLSPWSVTIKANGQNLGSFPVTETLKARLPEKLAAGRCLVELEFKTKEGGRGEGELPFCVKSASVEPALPAGKIGFKKNEVAQSGFSMVEIVQQVEGKSVLTGLFIPPDSPKTGQRFELRAENGAGQAIGSFSWSATWLDRLRGSRKIKLPLGESKSFVRFRLTAAGEGPPARWTGITLAGPPARHASPVKATKPSPPRLLILYVMDALRADTVGYMGGPPGVTPTLDRLASQGLTFLRHQTVAPNTLPSVKALFTGKIPVIDGWAKLPAGPMPTLAELIAKAGYRTAAFADNGYISGEFGLIRGFAHDGMMEVSTKRKNRPKSTFNDSAARVHAAALDWLRSLPRGERVFLYLHTLNPHNPYDPPEPFLTKFTSGISSTISGSSETLKDIKHSRVQASDEDWKRLRGLYAGSLAYNDAELGKFMDELARMFPEREIFLAVTADHGDELYDHGGVLHGYTLYREMLHIPLVLWYPAQLPPRKITAATSSVDLFATLLELAGAKIPTSCEGTSLLSLGEGENRKDEILFASASSIKGGIFSAQSERWKVVLAPRSGAGWGMGVGVAHSRDAEYLFDLEHDPQERVNKIGQGDLESAWLRSRLVAWVENAALRAEKAEEPSLSGETKSKLRALGYLE
jgi:arylsulfatase A-like enzyme